MNKQYGIFTSILLMIASIVLITYCLMFYDDTISLDARNATYLKKSSEKYWSEYPGKTKTKIVSKFNFYNLLNTDEDLLQNNGPTIVDETQPTEVIESIKYDNLNYFKEDHNDKSKSSTRIFADFEKTRLITDGQKTDNINTLNFAGLKYWFYIKNKSSPSIALTLLYDQIIALESNYYQYAQSLLSENINSLGEFKSNLFGSDIKASDEEIKSLYNAKSKSFSIDQKNGEFTKYLFECTQGQQTKLPFIDCSYFTNYFQINDTIFKALSSKYIKYFSDNFSKIISLDKHTFALEQWSSSIYSTNKGSFFIGNSTYYGKEISYFAKNYQKVKEFKLDINTVKAILRFDFEEGVRVPKEDVSKSLFYKKNIEAIMNKNEPKFLIDTLKVSLTEDQAFIILNYLRYLLDENGFNHSGTNGILNISKFVSSKLYTLSNGIGFDLMNYHLTEYSFKDYFSTKKIVMMLLRELL